MTTLVCYSGDMAANYEEQIARLRKVRRLVAGIDTIVDEVLPQGTLEERWDIARNMHNRMTNLAWQELATRASVNLPSQSTRDMVRFALEERLAILAKADRLNHGNNVSPIR